MTTAVERRVKAIEELYLRIHEYCEKIAQSELRIGGCIISPNDPSIPPPSAEVLNALTQTANQQFLNLGVNTAHLRYFDPPIRSIVKPIDRIFTKDDYRLTFQEISFDDQHRAHIWAQELLFCSSKDELGIVHNRWFVPQMEAIRLTTQLHDAIVEVHTIELIRRQFSQPWRSIFEPFVREYIVDDTHLGINTSERQLYQQAKYNWELLYPEIQEILPPDQKSVYESYKIFRKKWLKTRNDKVKKLLEIFMRHVEHSFIEKTQLNYTCKQQVLASLREHRFIEEKDVYPARRPVLCLSYSELYQFMRCILSDFGASPKNNMILGEMAIFIWISQHSAFSHSLLKVNIQRTFDLRVQDIDFDKCELIFLGRERIKISKGLTDLLVAWIGDADKTSRLFRHLNYENFRKRLSTVAEKMGAKRFKVQDFLLKAHPIIDVRISLALREKIDAQMDMVKGSPYKVDNQKIYEGLKQTLQQSRKMQ